jgi:hypothetical protein
MRLSKYIFQIITVQGGSSCSWKSTVENADLCFNEKSSIPDCNFEDLFSQSEEIEEIEEFEEIEEHNNRKAKKYACQLLNFLEEYFFTDSAVLKIKQAENQLELHNPLLKYTILLL